MEKCRECKYYYAQIGMVWVGTPHKYEVEMCALSNVNINDVAKCNGFEKVKEDKKC